MDRPANEPPTIRTVFVMAVFDLIYSPSKLYRFIANRMVYS